MDQYKPSNFTQPSNLRAAIKSGETLLGVGVSFPSVETAKRVATTGYDWAFVDCEHAAMTPILMQSIIHALSFHSQGKTIPVVRVPSHEPSFISTALDAGAAGIILPHTETREHAQHLVNECRFPPDGKRSYPPWSWVPGINDQAPEGQTIMTVSNNSIACIAQIESVLGVENAEDIISVEGIDCVMIGIGDLRLDMGLKFDWYAKEPEYIAAIDKIEALSRKYKKPLVGFAFPEMKEIFEDRVRRGYQLLMVAADLYTLTYGLATANHQCRATVASIHAAMKEEATAKVTNGQSNGIVTSDKSEGENTVSVAITVEA